MAVSVRLALATLVIGVTSGPSHAAFIDWWLTPDQQGRLAYARGDYQTAARRFETPEWKGLACYAAQDFQTAAEIFGRLGGPAAVFHLGNSLAHAGDLAGAIAAYRNALALRPDFPEAAFNLDWVEGLRELDEKEYDDHGGTGGKLGADGFVFDDRAKNAASTMTAAEAKAGGLSDAQLEELWMRRVQTTPGMFLQLRFASEMYAPPSEDTP